MQSKCKVFDNYLRCEKLNIIRENLINNSQNELVGGRNQEWKIINKIISRRLRKPFSPIIEEEKVKLKYDLKKIKPSEEWLDIYQKMNKELEDLGVPL